MSKTENTHMDDYLKSLKKASYEEKINAYYNSIHDRISGLDTSLNEIVHRHEKDFLSAFRTLMGQVQKELQKLRDLSDEQALMVKRDQAVLGLQDSLNWFQNEAVKLSEACSSLQTKYDEVRGKVHTLEAENSYLDTQIKLLMRQNQTLKEQFPKEEAEKPPEVATPEKTEAQAIDSDLQQIGNKYMIQDTPVFKEMQQWQKQHQKQTNDIINHYKNIIDNQKKKIKKICTENCTGFLQKNKLEEIFLDCVDEVRKDVIKRKALENSAQRARNMPHYMKEAFNSADKRRIIESFITKEEVVSFLYDQLFPLNNETDSKSFQSPGTYKTLDKNLPEPSIPNSSKSSRRKKPAVIKGKLLIDK